MNKLISYFKAHYQEIIRFVIVGVLATLADYLLYQLFVKVIYTDSSLLWGITGLRKDVVVGRSVGYTVGIIVNYIFSTFFVFKNVENKKTSRSVSGFIIFTLLSIGGLLINIGITSLGEIIYTLDNWWWNAFVFIFATLIVMVYNYITRKYILYREPKVKADQEES